ncbi:hypothetical protein D3C86_2073850 [compost metagenome]
MYVPVPPEAVMLIAPVEAPKHNTLVWVLVTVTALAGWVIVIVKGADVHPFASLTVTV